MENQKSWVEWRWNWRMILIQDPVLFSWLKWFVTIERDVTDKWITSTLVSGGQTCPSLPLDRCSTPEGDEWVFLDNNTNKSVPEDHKQQHIRVPPILLTLRQCRFIGFLTKINQFQPTRNRTVKVCLCIRQGCHIVWFFLCLVGFTPPSSFLSYLFDSGGVVKLTGEPISQCTWSSSAPDRSCCVRSGPTLLPDSPAIFTLIASLVIVFILMFPLFHLCAPFWLFNSVFKFSSCPLVSSFAFHVVSCSLTTVQWLSVFVLILHLFCPRTCSQTLLVQ